ncbi:hypothetical protein KIL84_010085 [Mauremys mutica]|uniref:Uncharacterized protein n=1 Tax=Mauremys mutica TaxID=74926 RepID=A0A9D3XMR9_9SAUR|nr:hypothetical protein KIL84_010085 [Mauremys mutica]
MMCFPLVQTIKRDGFQQMENWGQDAAATFAYLQRVERDPGADPTKAAGPLDSSVWVPLEEQRDFAFGTDIQP